MKNLLLVLMIGTCLLATGAQAAQEVAPREWFQCTADSDCVFVPGYCNDNTTINKKLVGPYTEMMSRSTFHCAKTEARLPDATPACSEGYCVINIPDEYKRN